MLNSIFSVTLSPPLFPIATPPSSAHSSSSSSLSRITRRRLDLDLKTGDSEASVTGPLLLSEFSGLSAFFISSSSEHGLFLPAMELLVLLLLLPFEPLEDEGLKNDLADSTVYLSLSLPHSHSLSHAYTHTFRHHHRKHRRSTDSAPYYDCSVRVTLRFSIVQT